MEERLAEFADVAFALELDAELLADGAGAAVAADQICRANRFLSPSAVRRWPMTRRVLLEGSQLAAEADGDVGQRFRGRSAAAARGCTAR